MWMPIRAIFGPLCVVPVKYGFCLAQIVLLYAVLVGVQLANYVWNSVETDLDHTAIPAVPSSLLNSVKTAVGTSVLYKSVQKVASNLGLSNSDLPATSIMDNHYECNTNNMNQFYRVGSSAGNNDNATMCVDSRSTLPSELLPQLTSYSYTMCQPSKFKDFNTLMHWFYEDSYDDDYPNSDGVLHDGIKVSPAGFPAISASSLSQQCVSAVDGLLTSMSPSGVKAYTYNFTVSNSGEQTKTNQAIIMNAHLGNTMPMHSQDGAVKPLYVDAVGNIQFVFSNQDYSNGNPNSYSKQANNSTNNIVNSLYSNDINQANADLNSYINGLNKSLLDYLSTSQTSNPQGVAETTANTSGVNSNTSYYEQCKNYLLPNQQITMRYLECLQLEESNQTYNLPGDHLDPEYPFKSYIDSWWIGGESYLSIDQIMNNNLESAEDELNQALSYPGMNILSTMHYNIPLSVYYYPIVNGNVPQYQGQDKQLHSIKDMKSNSVSTTAGIISTTQTVPNGLSMVSSTWSNLIYQTIPACTGQDSNKYSDKSEAAVCRNINQLQMNLLNLPNEWRPPFIYLLDLIKDSPKTEKITDIAENVKFLNNVFEFLQVNGIYQPTTVTSVPVYAVIDKIFNRLSGNGATDVTGVMNELYQLGIPADNLFSTIMQAQQVGADTVQAVINSFMSIFDNYQQQFNNVKNTAASMVKQGAEESKHLAYLDSSLSLFGASTDFSSLYASWSQIKVQLYMAAQIGSMSMSMAWLPLAFIVLGSLFTAGISFVVMMPLIPYFLFWAGTIVWVLSILEGLIAMPLVALVLVYPEGHEILGHASPGIKIALNIIFRPVLMAIGVIAAIALTYVLITYSAQGFHLVAPLVINNFSSSNMVQGIVSCFLIFIYSSFMMMAFSKCFSVIYLIPDKVFDWIGASSNQRAGAEDVQQLQGKTEGLASQSGQAMGSGVQQGIQAKQTETQSQVQADSQEIQLGAQRGKNFASMSKAAGEDVAKGVAEGAPE
ncbi:DotA/TraY family protein [Piscirickettsia litoralis]|uniref:DotA/TraY family protein n=1 Tax=Piscirickettsia litoralis TaxID=1891921 RepID=UPI001F3F7DA0|nr:DotA/TraY family protein [Piscirickettsia litoralis]